ncbi:MAG: NeuD/PglB/VioB family sugar acetyltransferase [Gaiellales bacterium]
MGGRYAIWGSGGHAKVIASIVQAQGGRVIALFDNADVRSVLPGVKLHRGLVGFETWASSVEDVQSVNGLVAIGGRRGDVRLEIQSLYAQHGLRLDPIVHERASVCDTASVGRGAQVLAGAVVAADARLGDQCIVNHNATVDHECVLGHGVHVAPCATLCGCVEIADNVMIGAGAVVLPRIRIGANALVGAGAVVTRNVAPGSVVIGNPARVHGAT